MSVRDRAVAEDPTTQASPDRVSAAPADELVTVVIPARDEAATIADALRSVLSQTHRHLQVLVVDGDSDDATAEIVAAIAVEDPRVELLSNPDRVIPAALNVAARHARGRWLVRIDAHSTVGDDYVERLVAHLATGSWGGVGGRKNGRGRTVQGRAIAAVTGSPFAQGNSVYHYGTEVTTVDHIPFGAYPVEVVEELGGWAEDQLVNEDYEFDYRVRSSGRELLFDPSIVIDWDVRDSVRGLFRQYRRYGAGKVQTLVKHPESAGVRHLAAPGMVAVLGVAVLAMLPRRTRRLGLLLAAPYLGIVVCGTVTTVTKVDGLGERSWVAPAFVALHLGWGLGFWQEALATAVGRGGARDGLARS